MQDNQEQNLQTTSVDDLFGKLQESYPAAQQRATEETRSFAKNEFFRMGKLGIYTLRVLPLAPSNDGTPSRLGYEHPIHQMVMEIKKPTSGAKTSIVYVTVPRATNAGHSVDLIDTYRKLAVETASEAGYKRLAEKIGGAAFGGGLKYNYSHLVYILDINERAKGLQLLTLSHSQFKGLEERKFKLWQKKLLKDPNHSCPISSIRNAYPIEIEKRKNGAKTEYLIDIDNESDNDVLSNDELTSLLKVPRIPEIVNRYSRYHFEATLEFLKQCDLRYEMSICEHDGFKDVAETLQSEIPTDDKSSFSFYKRGKGIKSEPETGSAVISLDDLFSEYEDLKEKGIGDKTEQGQDLRGLIRIYIEQEKLDIRITRATSNKYLLDMIEEALKTPNSEAEREPQESEELRDRRR